MEITFITYLFDFVVFFSIVDFRDFLDVLNSCENFARFIMYTGRFLSNRNRGHPVVNVWP